MISVLSVPLLLPIILVNFCKKIFCSGTLFMLFKENKNIRGSNTIHFEIKFLAFSRLIVTETESVNAVYIIYRINCGIFLYLM